MKNLTKISFEDTSLDGAFIINCFSVGDNRGGFTKTFEKSTYLNEAGIDFQTNETFFSISSKNVIRGLHFQLYRPQAKIVSVISGSVWDVIVDLRQDSETYKKWQGFSLSKDNHKSLYVPRGFAHGFLALEDQTILLYQCDGAYDEKTDTGIRFDDKVIDINWPISIEKAILSSRDLELMSFQEYESVIEKY